MRYHDFRPRSDPLIAYSSTSSSLSPQLKMCQYFLSSSFRRTHTTTNSMLRPLTQPQIPSSAHSSSASLFLSSLARTRRTEFLLLTLLLYSSPREGGSHWWRTTSPPMDLSRPFLSEYLSRLPLILRSCELSLDRSRRTTERPWIPSALNHGCSRRTRSQTLPFTLVLSLQNSFLSPPMSSNHFTTLKGYIPLQVFFVFFQVLNLFIIVLKKGHGKVMLGWTTCKSFIFFQVLNLIIIVLKKGHGKVMLGWTTRMNLETRMDQVIVDEKSVNCGTKEKCYLSRIRVSLQSIWAVLVHPAFV